MPYNLKDGFIMMHEKLCIRKQLRPNVTVEIHAPPYVRHCEINVTVKFYCPGLRCDVETFIRTCIIRGKV